MTVIAWDGKSLAADKRATNGGLARTVTKIRRIEFGSGSLLAGAAGDISSVTEAIYWVEFGRNPKEFPEFQKDKDCYAGLLVIDNGRILKYERSPFPVEFEDPIFAIGSGRDYALAAMHCGKTAKEAVEIACIFDVDCGNGVDVLELAR